MAEPKGFGGMKPQPVDDGGPSPEKERFRDAVFYIFPDSQSSRLARACGGVAQRTAQKWISWSVVPPDDVLEYVYSQEERLRLNQFPQAFERLIEEHGKGLDGEVIAAQVSRFYEQMMAYKIR
ncbi:hypothetical protein [Devosia sp. 1566]|uniref:hypothetical protein n=1 Tax=Devosia sp. 1566 TaxID=2499144 RepID=UPI000FDCBEC7|nr:hypothetical protein [Devosia sp. 1566]